MRPLRGVRGSGISSVVATVVVVLISTAATPQLWAQIPFSDARLKIEVNSTDGDAGLQVFVDAEAWESLDIFRPDGRKILHVEGQSSLGKHGQTELFSESSEPPFEELPLEEFLKRFPAGPYEFRGRTIKGEKLASTATLTHDIPAGPVLVSPLDGQVVKREDLVIAWLPVTRPRGIEIVSYQVIVAREEPTLLVFSVDLPATATSVEVPEEFLEPGTEYKFEVLAIEKSGNQTISESVFETRE